MGRILIIHADLPTRAILEMQLAQAGHCPILVTTGFHGIQAFRELKPDTTVVDVNLPDMDGLEVLKVIRAIDPYAEVIIFTAHVTLQQLQEARRLGAAGVLHDCVPSPIYH